MVLSEIIAGESSVIGLLYDIQPVAQDLLSARTRDGFNVVENSKGGLTQSCILQFTCKRTMAEARANRTYGIERLILIYRPSMNRATKF